MIVSPHGMSRRIIQQLIPALVIGMGLGSIMGCLVIASLIAQQTRLAALPQLPTVTRTAARSATITLAPPRTVTFTQGALLPMPTSTATPSLNTILKTAVGTPGLHVSAIPTLGQIHRPIAQHFLVGRPLTLDVVMPYPDPVYLYGTTEKGEYEVHHGEDLENPMGTPLFAVAAGVVVTAGSDEQPICGNDGKSLCGPFLGTGGYYGNLVVIQLAQGYRGQCVFALYGHLSQISVSVGDWVKQGDPIGKIGMTGIAIGPHVHFEIRIGTNDYAHTRNPILWMKPLAGHGSLTGRYSDSQGKPVPGALVDIYRADNTFVHETETYSRDQWPPVNSDDDLGENFAMGDLLAGDYVVRVYGQPFEQQVTIEDGKLSFVELGGSDASGKAK